MADVESACMDFPAPAVSPPPAPPLPPPPPAEAEALDVVVRKKRRPYRHKKFGCTVAEHIMKAVAATKERRGLTVAAMKKMLSASGCKGRNSSRIARPPIRSLKRGSLVKAVGSLAASTSVKMGGRRGRLTSGKLGPAPSVPDAKKGVGSKAAMSNFNSKRRRRRAAVHRKGAPRRPVKLARRSRKGERQAERRRKKQSLFRRNTRIRRSIAVLPVIRPHEGSNPQNLAAQSAESTCGENGSVHSR